MNCIDICHWSLAITEIFFSLLQNSFESIFHLSESQINQMNNRSQSPPFEYLELTRSIPPRLPAPRLDQEETSAQMFAFTRLNINRVYINRTMHRWGQGALCTRSPLVGRRGVLMEDWRWLEDLSTANIDDWNGKREASNLFLLTILLWYIYDLMDLERFFQNIEIKYYKKKFEKWFLI